MFALIRVAGKQYRVQNGTELLVNHLALDEGAAFEGAEVLMIGDGGDVQVGTPVVEGASVAATVVRHSKGRKIRVFKYKAKKNYRRRMGAREHQTLLRINSITGTSAGTQEQGTESQRTDVTVPVTAAPVAQVTPAAQATPVAQAPVMTASSQTEGATTTNGT